RQRLEIEPRGEEAHVGNRHVTALGLPDLEARAPGAEPAEPLRFEGIRVVALDAHARDGPRARAEDQAAFPARPPPALHPAGRDHEIADIEPDVGAVEARALVVARIRDAGDLQLGGEPIAHPARAQFELSFFTGRVGEGPQRIGIVRPRDPDGEAVEAAPCLATGGALYAHQRLTKRRARTVG